MSPPSDTSGPIVFGLFEPGIQYYERRAAYVVINVGGKVAMVGSGRKHFLPGGGSLPFESPELTVVREVTEELARDLTLLRTLGEAVQYFYSDSDQCHYKMQAAFFAGEFTSEPKVEVGEQQLVWLPVSQIHHKCFHECHAWAVMEAENFRS